MDDVPLAQRRQRVAEQMRFDIENAIKLNGTCPKWEACDGQNIR
jgi:hypothetical protein